MRHRYLFAVAAACLLLSAAHGNKDTSEQPPHGAPESSLCLVQSSRSISTIDSGVAASVWSGSSTDGGQPQRTAKREEKPQGNSRFQGSMRAHIVSLSEHSWARFARFISEQWLLIIVLFTLTFALLFPGMHWAFEKKEKERRLFAATFGEEETGGTSSFDSATLSDPGEGVAALLNHLRVDPRGGLDNCRLLMNDPDRGKWRRWGMLLMKLAAIGFNLYMMCVMDREMLMGAMMFYNGKSESDLPERLREYLRLTSNVSLISVRHAACVALAELIGLSAMITWISYRLMVFILFRRSPDLRLKFDAFLAAFEGFDGITVLGSYSALRLVSISHPILILTRFNFHMVNYASECGPAKTAFQATWFIVTRMAAVVLGIIAFGVKLAFASVNLHQPVGHQFKFIDLVWRWSVVVITLMQTLGAVSIERVLWNRVMFFIIAGGDGKVTLPKVQTAHVYLSRLVQAIFEEFWGKGEIVSFLVVMMTFDHADLQFMLLDEDEGGADNLVRQATQYFERHRATLEGASESALSFRRGSCD